jgi:hypothetical protein
VAFYVSRAKAKGFYVRSVPIIKFREEPDLTRVRLPFLFRPRSIVATKIMRMARRPVRMIAPWIHDATAPMPPTYAAFRVRTIIARGLLRGTQRLVDAIAPWLKYLRRPLP